MSWTEGACGCGSVRYTLSGPPMIIHACHCRDCQRISGGPFAINMWIEEVRFSKLSGDLIVHDLPTGSGKGQQTSACATCGIIVFTRYLAAPQGTIYVKAGTLDDPSVVEPDVHIYTRSKLPWLTLPEGARTFEEFYSLKEVWSGESRARLRAVMSPSGTD